MFILTLVSSQYPPNLTIPNKFEKILLLRIGDKWKKCEEFGEFIPSHYVK